MKKNIIKIVFCLIVILMVVCITTVSASSIIGQLDSNKNESTDASDSVKNTGIVIIKVIKISGTGIAVLMLLYIAIKYMMVSPSEKAEFKKTALIYVVGAIVLFAAPRLVELVMDLAQDVSNTLNAGTLN